MGPTERAHVNRWAHLHREEKRSGPGEETEGRDVSRSAVVLVVIAVVFVGSHRRHQASTAPIVAVAEVLVRSRLCAGNRARGEDGGGPSMLAHVLRARLAPRRSALVEEGDGGDRRGAGRCTRGRRGGGRVRT